jgi:subtilisin family serine protease
MARLSSAVLPLALVALAACGDNSGVVAPAAQTPQAPSLSRAPSADVVPGQYIVTFKNGVGNGPAKALEKVNRGNGRLKHTYTRVLNGFAAELSDAAVAALRLDPEVASVSPDPIVTVSATQTSAPWGLDRLDQSALPLSTTYTYANDGSGVTVYIVDTGIYTSHTDFGGRAVAGYDAVTVGGNAADCHGHGTHVAGTVGGTKYGVAKGVRLVAVRVLDCTGSGSGSQVLAGLDWVAAQKAASPSTPMVMNMSLGGSASTELDNGVQQVINAGIVAAVAAGNAGSDACTTSPARLAAAITVGATDSGDNFASFSNRGTCVDIEAPGVYITSDYYTSTTATTVMSGTSMATPHVAGAAALYLKANPTATPAQVAAALTANALVGVVKSVPASTVNKLLNVAFLAGGAPPPPPPVVAVAPKTSSVSIGGTVALTATVTNPVSGGAVSWVSRNTSVATVASTGATTATATAAGAGSTYIVSSYVAGATTVRDSALVTVATPTITLAPTSASILVGAAASLSATIGNPGTSGSIAWVSRSTAVATVAATGASTATATGAGAGATYVVASYTAGNTTVRDSVAVTVSSPTPPTTTYQKIVSAIATNPCASTKADPATVTPLVSNPCSAGAATQQFTLPAAGTSGPVRTSGGLCVVAAGTGGEGAAIVTAACNGTAAQNWTFNAAGEWRGGPADKCVGVFFGSTTPGTALVYYTCNGSLAKKWTVQAGS